ncbi:MAG: hypothetical protein ACTJLK_03070 [Anaplasma sp.]
MRQDEVATRADKKKGSINLKLKMHARANVVEARVSDNTGDTEVVVCKAVRAVTGNHPDASEHPYYVTHKENVVIPQEKGDHRQDEVLANGASNMLTAKSQTKSSTAAVISFKSNRPANNGASNELTLRSRAGRVPPRLPASKDSTRLNNKVVERPQVAVCSHLERRNGPLGNIVKNDLTQPSTKATSRSSAVVVDHLKSNVSRVKTAAVTSATTSSHPKSNGPLGNIVKNDPIRPKLAASEVGILRSEARPSNNNKPAARPSSTVGSRFGATKIASPEQELANSSTFTKKVSGKMSAIRPDFLMRTVKSKAKHCKEKLTKGAQSAFKAIDKALGTDIPISSRKYKFACVSDLDIRQPRPAYLLITAKDRREKAKLQNIIKNVKRQQVWIREHSLHTECGSIPVASLQFEILYANQFKDGSAPHHVSHYQIAIELNFLSRAEIAVTRREKPVSICHSGMSAEMLLEFGISRNHRVDILRLAATSVAFQDCKMSFFYAYTDTMLRAMLQHVRKIVYSKCPQVDGGAVSMRTIFNQYTEDSPDDMANAILEFFTVHPLGRELYFDVSHNFDSIDALVRYGIASGSYPSQHARFWELVLREVWGQENCKTDALPKHFSSITSRNALVVNLHLICALVCKKRNITNREELASFICTLMHPYDEREEIPYTHVMHYLAYAAVMSPRLALGLGAMRIEHASWHKLVKTIGHTVQILKKDVEYHDIGALSDVSGEKKPCNICATTLQNFSQTTTYKIVGSVDPSLRHMDTLGSEIQKGRVSPYAILVSDLAAVYCLVRDCGRVTQTLLNSWRSLQKAPQNEPCLPEVDDLVSLLEKTAHEDEVLSERNPREPCVSYSDEYPFTDEVLAQVGDTALTSFLTAISISPVQKPSVLFSDDCTSTYLNVLV